MPTSPNYISKITIFDLKTRTSSVIHEGEGIIEAPNWSRDGSYLLVNTRGGLFRLSPTGGELSPVPIGSGGYCCNNDHDLSPDGKHIAFSATCPESAKSQIFVCKADGTDVNLLTLSAPSYFHGWSPDGKWLAFVAERGNGHYELYRVSIQGGDEERLTFAGGHDDGSEYSPDGRWIYFNSNRTGRWEIWRIPSSGAGKADALAQQITDDAPADWFPHLSPDGGKLLWLSFPTGTVGHDDRMPGMQLRMQDTPSDPPEQATIEVLTEFYGGQGSINVNSWSPDSQRFAFVTYAPVSQEATET